MSDKQPTYEERIGTELESTLESVCLIWGAYQLGLEGSEQWDADDITTAVPCNICGNENPCNDAPGGYVCQDCLDKLEELGPFNEYGLGFDYVAAGTLVDQDARIFSVSVVLGRPIR